MGFVYAFFSYLDLVHINAYKCNPDHRAVFKTLIAFIKNEILPKIDI